jgi:hypothetical protein
LIFNGLHGLISLKTDLFLTTAVRTWNPRARTLFARKVGFMASCRLKSLFRYQQALSSYFAVLYNKCISFCFHCTQFK